MKIKRIYRFHVLLKAERREALGHALRAARAHADAIGIPRGALIYDIDPVSLM
jgi:primosomal protein N' (replication factor Y)